MKKVLFRFQLFGKVKEFWAYHIFDLANGFRKSYPQHKDLRLSDLKGLKIVEPIR